MTQGPKEQLTQYRLQQAHESLKEAQHTLKDAHTFVTAISQYIAVRPGSID